MIPFVRRLLPLLYGCVCATLLASCGGGGSPEPSGGSQVVAADPDGAQVVLRHVTAAPVPTVTVARDATGAPPLPDGVVPLTPIWQFGPVDLAAPGIRLRIPFKATENSRGRLLWSAQGEAWTEMVDAVFEADAVVATVPRLGHLVVVAAPADAPVPGRSRALAAGQAVAAAPALAFSIDPATAPAPTASQGTFVVKQDTSLVLRADHDLPATCPVKPRLGINEFFFPRNGGPSRSAQVLDVPLAVNKGAVAWTRRVTGTDDGWWVYGLSAVCAPPGVPTVYSYTAALPVVDVQIAGGAAPMIVSAPASVAVTAGASATFSVVASGTGFTYQWQRSNDGGLTYASVAGATASSFTVTAALADSGSFWRVIVKSATGQTASAPARLTVTQTPGAPAITGDPVDQTVVEGQTASFTVRSTGTPAPTVQWQRRAAALTDPNAGWADIMGATAGTYITLATTLANNGNQFRVVVRNSAGTATSLAVTLTVTPKLVAPSIVVTPKPATVLAGQSGLFSVTASGSSPLSYQWFKNGIAIVGANAAEVRVPAVQADVGASYAITVRVSNAAGSITSAPAAMTINAPPGGTLIKASEGGVLQAGTTDASPSLVIDAKALAGDAIVSLVTEASTVVNLPPDISPLGDVLSVGPANVAFSVPATLYLPVPALVPEGKVLGIVEIRPTTIAAAPSMKTALSGRSDKQTLVATGNLRRLATASSISLGVSQILATDSITIRCPDTQSVRGGSVLVDLARTGVRFVAAAVPESQCSGGTTAKPRKTVPSTSTAPCRDSDFPAVLGAINQVSRHVHCQRDQASVRLVYSPATGPSKYFGEYLLSWRIGTDGPADRLSKTFRIKLRLTPVDTVGAEPLAGLIVKPVFECGLNLDQGLCSVPGGARPLGSGSEVEIVSQVEFAWSGGKNTFKEFTMGQIALRMAFTGENIDTAGATVYMSAPPTLRCDKKLADGVTDGCVFSQAPAVLVLSATDPSVKEAAQHIRDAQFAGAPGALTSAADGSLFATVSNALSRTQVTGLKGNAVADGANRLYACGYTNSAIKLRPQASATCAADGSTQSCQCDEYPFNATWNGAYSTRGGPPASARFVNGSQNGEAGRRLGRFFKAERVVDFTPDPGIVFNLDNPSLSIPNRVGGDDFWTYIE